MGVLIDDLLLFSRTGRAELHNEDVDMERVMNEALDACRLDVAGREVDWVIGPLPRVTGDPALLRQVWASLLDNAVKHTRGRTPPRVEIGVLDGDPDADEDAFFVRDNGVGFNMA